MYNYVSECESYQTAIETLEQGWATSSIGGPYVGRRSPSRARLLGGSSSISSTTPIVKAALIRSAKKRSTRPQMFCFPPKISVKQQDGKNF